MDLAGRPRTWRGAIRESGIVLAALLPCPLVALLAPAVRGEALGRGADVARFERSLGWLPEPALHAWASAHPPLLDAAWGLYVFAHLPAVIGALVWAWLERPRAYAAARSTFVLAQALTVSGYVLLPSAPPQYVRAIGGHPPAGGEERLAHLLQSPWAAIPSAHVAFATVAAGIVVALARPLAVRVLAVCYPLLVIVVTLATGNHFWLDGAAGVLVAACAAAVVAAARRPSLRPAPSRSSGG